MTDSRYIEPPTIPAGMTIASYRKQRTRRIGRIQRFVLVVKGDYPEGKDHPE